jgi:CheY-like chemotaxis protein/curved DNA-binding protein CbpA
MPATVLCVDNDRALVQILAKALGGEGYEVQTAFDGDQAIEMIAGSTPPDLVLLDLILPRRDGFQVLEALRGLDAPVGDTPVVLLTGCSPSPEYRSRAESLGAVALLTKPQPLDDLLGIVREHAGEARSDSGSQSTARAEDKAAPLSGSLENIPFPGLIHHLHGLRASGVLHLGNGKRRKWIEFAEGYPIAVRSNLVSECLGNFLVRTGRISHEAVTESRRHMESGQLQGEVLVAMDALAKDDVTGALEAQAEEKLFEIFEWPSGKFRFERGARLQRANELAVAGSPANLILRGVRERVPIARVDAFLTGNADAMLVPAESPFYRFQEIELEPDHQRLLGGLDGSRRLEDFRSADEDLRRVLYGLAETGLLELRGGGGRPVSTEVPIRPVSRPTQARPDEEALRAELAGLAECMRLQDHFEALGVGENADPEALRAAYERLSAQVHPDRTSGSSRAIQSLASEVANRVTEAYQVLGDPKRRVEYLLERRKAEREAADREAGRQVLDAELEFQNGESAMRQRDYGAALRHFGKALELYPEEGEYHAHYGWALHLSHPGSDAMLHEAIEHVRKGLKLASRSEKSYLFLGRLCKARGSERAAEKMFTRAVQIEPNCAEALSELRLMHMRREKKKGFVRRLLRR